MILFLKRFFVFISLPLILIILTDGYLKQKNTLYKEKLHGLIQDKVNVEIIILGNSHANYGVDPTAFEMRAYNIANVNQSIYFDKRILLSQLDELKNLKYVLISADYHSLYFSSQGIRDTWSYYDTGVHYKNNNYFFEDISPSLFGYTPKTILSLYKRDIINKLIEGDIVVDFPVQKGVNLNDTITNGFIGFEGADSMAFNEDKFKSRARTFTKIIEGSRENLEVEEDLKGLINILLSRGIIPVLFTTPTFIEYNNFLNQDFVKNNDYDFKRIAEENNILYWNFMNSELFKKDDFFDHDHLNKKGAYKMGRILNDSLNKTIKEGKSTFFLNHNL